jgi:hypothetical protein
MYMNITVFAHCLLIIYISLILFHYMFRLYLFSAIIRWQQNKDLVTQICKFTNYIG